jgi:chromosome segregation ATPase
MKRKNSETNSKSKKTKAEKEEIEDQLQVTELTPITSQMPEFRKGAIRKISMKNFMTYDDCSFEPGPGLNLVLGPNGTGKSSIVSAICLGLCGKPTLLGRASKADSYIKHGKQDAFVEIELHGKTDDERMIIRRDWKKGTTATVWKLNGKTVGQHVVEQVVEDLNIKLDNLTQFLPQDRVAEFAGLGPVDLLKSTQEAVLPPEMTTYHQRLIDMKKDQVEHAKKMIEFETSLETLRKKNATLEKDVELFNRRKKHLEKVEQLTLKKPQILFETARSEGLALKTKKEKAEKELAIYEEKMKPLTDQIKKKNQHIDELEKQRAALRNELKQNKNIESLSQKIEENMNKASLKKSEIAELWKRQGEREARKKKFLANIERIKIDLQKFPNIEELEAQIKTKTQESNDWDTKLTKAKENTHEYKDNIFDAQRELKQCTDRMKELDSVNARRLEAIRRNGQEGSHAYDCWQWIQKQTFTEEVYFLPLQINVPDAIHAKYLEFHCPKFGLLCFVTQNSKDREFIQHNFVDPQKKNISIINFEKTPKKLNHQVDLSVNGKKCGVTKYLDEVFSAPDIIKSVLEDICMISKAGIGTSSTSLDGCQQYIPEVTTIYTPDSRFVKKYTKNVRSHSSTSVIPLREGKIFIGVDMKQRENVSSKIEEISAKIKNLEKTKQELEKEEHKIMTSREEARAQVKASQQRKKDIVGLQGRINREQQNLEELEEEEDITKREAELTRMIKVINTTASKLVSDFTREMKKYHEVILKETYLPFKLAKAQDELREFLGLESEYHMKRRELGAEVEEATSLLNVATLEAKNQKDRANKALLAYEEKYGMTREQTTAILLRCPDDLIALETQIEAENSAANRIVNDPNVIAEYERQKKQIEEKTEKVEAEKALLIKQEAEMNEILLKWEPSLTSCVDRVNTTFTQYCKNIGITGEVALLKNDDYALWAIQIQVKFRDAEALSVLTSTRQSGGERSVTTMLYLLALQEVNKCPLRVVDEINQGMDPINERKIFLQMLEASRGKDVPQSFLITPKLLSNLVPNNCEIITVLFIYNGPHNTNQRNLLNELK